MLSLENFLGFIKNYGIGEMGKFVDNIIDGVIESINDKYNEMYDLRVFKAFSKGNERKNLWYYKN